MLSVALGLNVDTEARTRAMVDAIADEAKILWGENWLREIVRAYCESESLEFGETVRTNTRRSTIVRALETGAITLETLIRLADCVSMTLVGEVQRKQIKRF